MQTGRKTVIPGATAPETETQGYVTYQTQRLCLTTFPNTEKEVDNMAHRGVFMVNFQVFENVVKHASLVWYIFPIEIK